MTFEDLRDFKKSKEAGEQQRVDELANAKANELMKSREIEKAYLERQQMQQDDDLSNSYNMGRVKGESDMLGQVEGLGLSGAGSREPQQSEANPDQVMQIIQHMSQEGVNAKEIFSSLEPGMQEEVKAALTAMKEQEQQPDQRLSMNEGSAHTIPPNNGIPAEMYPDPSLAAMSRESVNKIFNPNPQGQG